jgi:alpha-galactosidase
MTHAVRLPNEGTAVATQMAEAPDAQGFPVESAWARAKPVVFQTDWQGRNADPELATEVRLLWTPELLFVRFRARFQTITVFADAEASGHRDKLWDRDVAEIFLQPDASDPWRYKEFEVSPNGFWIDLDIRREQKHDLKSGLRRRVAIDEQEKTWVAEVSIPMKSLEARVETGAVWRVNFYRVEGAAEPRFYSAWRPTNTPKPNFHVPEAYGKLVFVPAPEKNDQAR